MSELYCGFVEDNLDPLKIGRLRIRIPHIHGANPNSSMFTPTSELQWAYPCMPFFAGYDCGSFIVPPVGTYVWVIPESGENSHFVYFGGVYGTGPENPKPMNTLDSTNSSGISMGKYYTPTGQSEVPGDLDSSEYGQSGVLFKSQKGHTIKYSDQDNAEYLEIIDRSGQTIKFECPVSAIYNKGNAARRGSSKEFLGCKLHIRSGKSEIVLDNDSIKLYNDNTLIILDETDKNNVKIKAQVKDNTVTMDKDSIQAQVEESQIEMNKDHVLIKSKNSTLEV